MSTCEKSPLTPALSPNLFATTLPRKTTQSPQTNRGRGGQSDAVQLAGRGPAGLVNSGICTEWLFPPGRQQETRVHHAARYDNSVSPLVLIGEILRDSAGGLFTGTRKSIKRARGTLRSRQKRLKVRL